MSEVKIVPVAVPVPVPVTSPTITTAGVPTLGKLKGTALRKMSSIEHDELPGGKADEVHQSEFDPKQLAMGVKIEREHTNDPQLAEEIAEDHLTEHDKYYTALKKMEAKLEQGKTAAYRLGIHTAIATFTRRRA